MRCVRRWRSARTNCPSRASSSRCVTTSATGKAPPSGCCAASASRCWCPDAHYKAVADWVDRQHLGARLVYFHVRPRKATQGASSASAVAGAQARHQAGFATLRVAGAGASPALRRGLLRHRASSSAARPAPSRAPVRSRTRAGATRRTTAAASTTAAATCSAGAMPTSCAPCGTSGSVWRESWPRWGSASARSSRRARNCEAGWTHSPGWRSSRALRTSTG